MERSVARSFAPRSKGAAEAHVTTHRPTSKAVVAARAYVRTVMQPLPARHERQPPNRTRRGCTVDDSTSSRDSFFLENGHTAPAPQSSGCASDGRAFTIGAGPI